MDRTSALPSMTDRLTEGLLRLLRWSLCRLPEPVALAVGVATGDLLRLILAKKRRIVRENLAKSDLDLPDLSSARRLERRIFRHFGRMGVEFLRLGTQDEARLRNRVDIDGIDYFKEELRRGKGVLLLSGHIGNWEMALRRLNLEAPGMCQAVVRRIKNPAVHRFVADHRCAYGGAASVLGDLGVRPILRALREGKVVGVMLDQNAGEAEGVFVPFMGRLASTYTSLARLSLTLGIPVLPAAAIRRPDGRYTIVLSPPIPPSVDLPVDEAIFRMTALYTRALEDRIRPHPEQWIWMHRRWKTRPPTEDEEAPSSAPPC